MTYRNASFLHGKWTSQRILLTRHSFWCSSEWSFQIFLSKKHCSPTYTRGRDIYDAIKNMITEQNIPIQKLVAMTTDGAPAMIGRNVGFIGLCEKDEAFPKFNSYHCVIHQENLIAKKLNLDHVMSVIVRIVNFIRGRALNHRLFKDLLDELDSAHGHLIYFAEVRWLSRGKLMTRFIGLMTEIKIFLHSKDSYEEKL